MDPKLVFLSQRRLFWGEKLLESQYGGCMFLRLNEQKLQVFEKATCYSCTPNLEMETCISLSLIHCRIQFEASSVYSSNESHRLQNVSEWKHEREERKRVVLNNAGGISSRFNSDAESSCCFFFSSSPPLLLLLLLHPSSLLSSQFLSVLLAAVFSAALKPRARKCGHGDSRK